MFHQNSYQTFRDVLKRAGTLFSEKGYDDTTMEMIAEVSGVSLEELQYRFGSKDKLYAEVFYMLIESDRKWSIDSIVREHPSWSFTGWGQSRIIRRKIRYVFSNLNDREFPWKAALLAREMNSPVLQGENQLDYIFRQLFGDLECFYRHIRPDMSDSDLYYCCCLPITYINFFLLKMPSLPEENDDGKVRELALFTTKTVLRFLGLPEDGDDYSVSESREFEILERVRN